MGPAFQNPPQRGALRSTDYQGECKPLNDLTIAPQISNFRNGAILNRPCSVDRDCALRAVLGIRLRQERYYAKLRRLIRAREVAPSAQRAARHPACSARDAIAGRRARSERHSKAWVDLRPGEHADRNRSLAERNTCTSAVRCRESLRSGRVTLPYSVTWLNPIGVPVDAARYRRRGADFWSNYRVAGCATARANRRTSI
jgi:hypothetical protein